MGVRKHKPLCTINDARTSQWVSPTHISVLINVCLANVTISLYFRGFDIKRINSMTAWAVLCSLFSNHEVPIRSSFISIYSYIHNCHFYILHINVQVEIYRKVEKHRERNKVAAANKVQKLHENEWKKPLREHKWNLEKI